MPCYSPITGYLARFPNSSGKRSIVFDRSSGFVDQPVTLPCGQCIGCRIDKSRSWAIRCTHESKLHQSNSFLTLTYSPEKIPLHGSLDKEELQRFFKRLRKRIGPFRYFACGEYGDTSQRPHYHIILFGHDFSSDRKLHSRPREGQKLYVSNNLESAWGNGNCTIGAFSYQSAAYTARYCMKKQMGKDAHERDEYQRVNKDTGEIVLVAPEFCLMSRNPGIGSKWYDKFSADVFPSDYLVVDGKKHPVPRYYLEKLRNENSESYSDIKSKRNRARALVASDNTPERLYVKEQCKKAKLNQLKRSV